MVIGKGLGRFIHGVRGQIWGKKTHLFSFSIVTIVVEIRTRVKITVCGCCGLLYGEVGPHTEQVDGVDRLLLSGSSPPEAFGDQHGISPLVQGPDEELCLSGYME
ncbi:hypothetical protein GQ457_15G005360 [Hibiscus cannabinus]